MKTILFLAAALFVTTGCATKVWYQSGVSQDEADREVARAKLLYGQSHPTELSASGMISQSVEAGNFVDNYMQARGYHRVPKDEATNAPVRLGNHVD